MIPTQHDGHDIRGGAAKGIEMSNEVEIKLQQVIRGEERMQRTISRLKKQVRDLQKSRDFHAEQARAAVEIAVKLKQRAEGGAA